MTTAKQTTVTTRIMALEGQMHSINELLAQLVAQQAAPVAPAPAPAPAPAAPTQPRRDDWLPHYDACNFSRPVVAVFDDGDYAFEYRAFLAEGADHPVAVRHCRVGPKGNEFRGYAVY